MSEPDCERLAGFESDKGVALVLKKMFTTALEVPPESVSVDEKIHVPTDLQMPTSKPAFLGYVVSSVVKREATRTKVFFPLDVLVKHGIITGSSGKGKTFFAAHLALEACRQNVKVIIIDPHGTFRFMPKHENMEIHFVSSAQEVIDLLDRIYNLSMQQPIQKEDRIKTLVIVDEISSGKFGPDIKRISKRLDNCYTELRKFGTGMVVICQHLSESRGISTAVRENTETLFLFRKKELNELERVRTLRHPSLSLLPYLPVGFMAIVSEDFHSEPFFVRIPRVRTLSRNMEAHDDEIPAATNATVSNTDRIGNVRSGQTADTNPDTDADLDADDNADDDDDDDSGGGDDSGRGASDDGGNDGSDSGGDGGGVVDDGGGSGHGKQSGIVHCKKCGYDWKPKKKPEEIRQCPRCNSRRWKGDVF